MLLFSYIYFFKYAIFAIKIETSKHLRRYFYAYKLFVASLIPLLIAPFLLRGASFRCFAARVGHCRALYLVLLLRVPPHASGFRPAAHQTPFYSRRRATIRPQHLAVVVHIIYIVRVRRNLSGGSGLIASAQIN